MSREQGPRFFTGMRPPAIVACSRRDAGSPGKNGLEAAT